MSPLHNRTFSQPLLFFTPCFVFFPGNQRCTLASSWVQVGGHSHSGQKHLVKTAVMKTPGTLEHLPSAWHWMVMEAGRESCLVLLAYLEQKGKKTAAQWLQALGSHGPWGLDCWALWVCVVRCPVEVWKEQGWTLPLASHWALQLCGAWGDQHGPNQPDSHSCQNHFRLFNNESLHKKSYYFIIQETVPWGMFAMGVSVSCLSQIIVPWGTTSDPEAGATD